MIERHYLSLAFLQDALTAWVGRVTTADVAEKVTLHALSLTWALSAVGWWTDSGPWAMTFEHAYLTMIGQVRPPGPDMEINAMMTIPVPGRTILRETADLYVSAYRAVMIGQMSMHEVRLIGAAISNYSFIDAHSESGASVADDLAAHSPALWRAVEATEEHGWDGCTACVYAQTLRQDEYERGCAWAGTYSATKGESWHDR